MKKHIANIITALRILIAFILNFAEPMSKSFLLLYLVGGISDMLDGTIARKQKIESRLGSILDSVADCLFMAVCVIKLLPVLTPPLWAIIWGAVIFATRIIISAGWKLPFITHSVLNKITGFVLYITPFLLFIKPFSLLWLPPCILASMSPAGDIINIKKR